MSQSQAEWLADLGKAAEELGYGVRSLDYRSVTLIAGQSEMEVTVESVLLSGALLRQTLVPIPHRSGSALSHTYEMETVR